MKAPTRIQSRSWRRMTAGGSDARVSVDMNDQKWTETTPSAVPRAPHARQGAGAVRSDSGAGPQAPGTSGASAGTNGADRRDLLTGAPIIIAVTLGFLVVNALT